MRITYLANARLPTEKAHGIQISKMCESLAGSGADVELVLPKRLNHIKADIFGYYGVKRNFSIKKLFCLDALSLLPIFKSIGYWIESFTFALSAGIYLRNRAGVVYIRELLDMLFLSKKHRVIWEAHHLPARANWLFWSLLKKVDKFVVITRGLKSDLMELGIAENKIMVAADAVDLAQFDIHDSIIEAREKLHLPMDRQIALYTGHLYAWKGSGTLLQAAALLPETLFVTVGGTADDREEFLRVIEREKVKNILCLPHRPPLEMPLYLKSADVLLLPNSAKEKISSRFTSPLKMFEYMAAKRPIISSDLPSLREVLDETSAMFFTPDDAKSLANAIQTVFNNPDASAKRAEAAHNLARNYSWVFRERNVLSHIKD